MRKYTSCTVHNCQSKGHTISGVEYFTRGYCKKHYLRLIRYGDISVTKMVKGEDRSNNPLYPLYIRIKQRCYNPNNAEYSYYGGRGIKMCDTWLGNTGFNNFVADMGERPDGMEIDRIDVDGNYTPENCRWATRKEQMRNTRRTKYISKNGVTKPLADWADIMGVTQKSLWNRVLRGDNDERILRPMVRR